MEKKNIILIADDIDVNRAILKEVFKNEYTIMEASDGEEALSIIYEYASRISIVLLDIIMPKMNGFDVLERMYIERLIEYIPVVLITTDNTYDAEIRGYNLGVSDIIAKPFNPYVVRRRVQNVVDLFSFKLQNKDLLDNQNKIEIDTAEKFYDEEFNSLNLINSLAEFKSFNKTKHSENIRTVTKNLLHAYLQRKNNALLDNGKIQMIADASIFHDIGMHSVNENILNKKDKLTKQEYDIIKKHPDCGCEILDSLTYLKDRNNYSYCIDIVKFHHERWDGTGYPYKLRENEIPLWAQAVGLADCYVSLMEDRIYRPAYSHKEACRIILSGGCGGFSPEFIDIIENLSEHLYILF